MITPGTIIGEYRIDGLLGRGGMAEVYKAWRMNLQRYEALKVLLPERAGDYSFTERFLKEARTVASLSHSNIAAVYTVSGENAPQPFFTMEMVEGINLSELIKKHGRLSLRQTLLILWQVASAVDYAHSRGLIHRDIKPANILLKREGNNYIVKVVDFGIAKAAEDNGNTRLTQMGTFVGTPEYISPEQANGAMVDGRTDQYSLAIMAYEMLCGEPPFKGRSGTSTISVITEHLRDAAKAKGLKIDVTTGKSNDIDAGRVISQYPRAGIGVPRGATLRVRISTGGDKITVAPTPQYRPTPPSAPPHPTYYWPSPDAPAYTYPLSYNDLYGKSNWELDIMRNTIYARYGRGFN